MAIRLDSARARVQDLLMKDECVITRDQLGTQDWVINQVTGLATSNSIGDTTQYSGICHVAAGSQGGSRGDDLGVQDSLNTFTVHLPWSSGDEVAKGDYVTLTVSEDPTLLGKKLRIAHVKRGSTMVWRALTCELLESTRDG